MVVLGIVQDVHMLCWKWWRQRGNITDAVVVLHLIPRGADTAEGALQVLAGAWGAGPRQAHALVDVCRRGEITSDSVCAQLRGLGCRVPYCTQALPYCTLLCPKDARQAEKTFSRMLYLVHPGNMDSALQDVELQEAEWWTQVTRVQRACLPAPRVPARRIVAKASLVQPCML